MFLIVGIRNLWGPETHETLHKIQAGDEEIGSRFYAGKEIMNNYKMLLNSLSWTTCLLLILMLGKQMII